jgi:hypothetical protein
MMGKGLKEVVQTDGKGSMSRSKLKRHLGGVLTGELQLAADVTVHLIRSLVFFFPSLFFLLRLYFTRQLSAVDSVISPGS